MSNSNRHEWTSFSHCSRVLAHVVIGLLLGVVMASCGGDSSPVAPTNGPSGPSGWFWQNPRPQGNNLLAVSFTDANTGTAVGELGTIVRTTDGGGP
ncbi:MAG: hypothetical protein ACE5EO_10505 [Candidatus Krumholzibacteriia bacterium]